MTLEDRIVRLEAKLKPLDREPLFFTRVIVQPGPNGPVPESEKEYQHLQCGGQCWARREDESEDDFKDRAMREAVRSTRPIVFTVNRPLARLLQAP